MFGARPALAAQPTEILVAPVQQRDEGEALRIDLDDTQRKLGNALAGQLETRFALSSADKADCAREDRGCWVNFAADTGAAFVVWPILAADGGDSHVRIDVIDVASGKTAKQTEHTCEICGQAEFDEFLEITAGRLAVTLEGVRPEPATLAVLGEPYGAQIRLDGAVVGTVPWEGEVTPGLHEIEIEKFGFVDHHRGVEAPRGARTKVSVDLLVDDTYKKRVLRATAWSMVGVGVGTTIAGGVLIGLHDQPHRRSCNTRDIDGRCPNEYDSLGPGIALTVTGSALTLGGGGILVYQRVKDRQVRGEARLQPGLTRVGLEVTF